MKILLFIAFFMSSMMVTARAEIKEILYDGKEIYVHVKKDHVSAVIFPEPINGIIRGFGADTYVVQREGKKPDTLEMMPTDSETAEMTVSGASGEDYVLRFVANDNFYTKLIIHRMGGPLDKGEDKTINTKMDVLPETVIEKQIFKSKTISPALTKKEISNLPPELNIKITLKGNDLPLKIYLSTISQVTGYNLITTPDIDAQKTSINVDNIEVWRALKSLLYKFGWGFKVSKEDLIITSQETRLFNIRIPAVEQTFTDQTSNTSYTDNQNNASNGNSGNNSGNQQGQDIKVGTKIFYENSAPKLSLWTDLENSIKSLISPQTGTYSISKSSGTITVTDKPGVLDKIAEIIESTNEILSRQETFEIQIYEVSLSHANETGLDWAAIEKNIKGINALSLATNFSSSGFVAGQFLSLAGSSTSSGNNGVAAVLKALESQGEVHTISKPQISVSNLFPAIIQEVTSIPYISGTGQTATNNSTITNVLTSQVSDGLTMRLQAKMAQDNKTELNISVAVNTLNSMTSVPVGGGLQIQEPQVSTKSITTNVEIEEGKTLVLGGLISTTRNNAQQGIPYLSKIPYIGNAFSYKNNSSLRQELVIFISPMRTGR